MHRIATLEQPWLYFLAAQVPRSEHFRRKGGHSALVNVQATIQLFVSEPYEIT